jgi:hypothetical protein
MRAATSAATFLLPVVLVGCADLTGSPSLASLDIVPFTSEIAPGDTMRLTAIAIDDDGDRVLDARIEWNSANLTVVTVSDGLVTGVASGGPVLITASAGGQSAVAQVTVRPTATLSPTVAAMFARLGDVIASTLQHTRDLIPLNPGLVAELEAKIALLEQPTLATEIIEGAFFEEVGARSADERILPIVSVFTLAPLRAEADAAVRFLAASLAIQEDFIGVPFPGDAVRVWQGFTLGNRGGGGTIEMEDRATYERRTPSTRLPWDAILAHELAHSYVGSESLTQFLELYTYNRIVTGSADVDRWVHTRGYVPRQATNANVHALLDIYLLIGEAPMGQAYAAVRAFHPRYGEPLSAEAQQVFIDAAPPAVRSQVAARIAAVRF